MKKMKKLLALLIVISIVSTSMGTAVYLLRNLFLPHRCWHYSEDYLHSLFSDPTVFLLADPMMQYMMNSIPECWHPEILMHQKMGL